MRRFLFLVVISIFVNVAHSGQNLVFKDSFFGIDSPTLLVGTIVPDTRPVLMWDGSQLLDLIPYGDEEKGAVFLDTAEVGSGPAYVVTRSNPSLGVEVANFRLTVDLLYFDTLSNGGNNFGRINYYINTLSANPMTGTTVGYSLEYRFRVDGTDGFECRLQFNDGSGPVEIEGTSSLIQIPGQRNSVDGTVPGSPIRLTIEVNNGRHTLQINNQEVFSIEHRSRVRAGYFNIIPLNNRNNGFSRVALETI